jgi:hypothetical protein
MANGEWAKGASSLSKNGIVVKQKRPRIKRAERFKLVE